MKTKKGSEILEKLDKLIASDMAIGEVLICFNKYLDGKIVVDETDLRRRLAEIESEKLNEYYRWGLKYAYNEILGDD